MFKSGGIHSTNSQELYSLKVLELRCQKMATKLYSGMRKKKDGHYVLQQHEKKMH
jgi:hypothetical protein